MERQQIPAIETPATITALQIQSTVVRFGNKETFDVIHIRVDDEELNSKRRFACGIGPELPDGDVYFFLSEAVNHHLVDCPGCGGHKVQFGTPLSHLSGRPGHPGYGEFKRIARSWGYD